MRTTTRGFDSRESRRRIRADAGILAAQRRRRERAQYAVLQASRVQVVQRVYEAPVTTQSDADARHAAARVRYARDHQAWARYWYDQGLRRVHGLTHYEPQRHHGADASHWFARGCEDGM